MTRLLLRLAATATTLSFLISAVTAQTSTASAAGTIQTTDCYSSIPSDYTNRGSWTFQTSGYCQSQCAGFSVMAITEGSTCYCGNELPSDSDKTSSDSCNTPCQGFDAQTCGGTSAFQLYLTGAGTVGAAAGDSGSSSSSPTTATPSTTTSAVPSVVTKSGQVVTVTASAATHTAPASSSTNSAGSGGGSSKVGIAVGVVVGVVAIAAIVGGLVFFLKRRRRLAIEEEHRRSAAVSKFVNGGKSETSSTTDARLDPAVFSHRRNSLGSIADEQDFSRRILQVRNPDRDSKASNMQSHV